MIDEGDFRAQNIFNFIKKIIITIAVTFASLSLSFTLFKNEGKIFLAPWSTVIIASNDATVQDKQIDEKDSVKATNISETTQNSDSSSVKLSKLDVKTNNIKMKENNTLGNALIIENNKKYSMNFMSENDVRFYKLVLDYSSKVYFSVGFSNDISYKLNIKNFDTQNTVFDTEVSSENIFLSNGDIYLKKGVYIIKITAGNCWKKNAKGNNFSFTAKISSYDETVITETEYNNTKETANKIPIKTFVKASMYKNDVDCFRFALDKRAEIYPKLVFIALDNDIKKLYDIKIESENEMQLGEIIFNADCSISGKKDCFKLDAGTYIMKVSWVKSIIRPDLFFHEYELCISEEN